MRMIWTFLTPNLLSAVMSQRQMQKLKCLLEESCLTVIQSVLEKRGTSVHLWIQAGGDQKGSMQLTKDRPGWDSSGHVCASVGPGVVGTRKAPYSSPRNGPGWDSSFLLLCSLTFTDPLNPPARQALKFHLRFLFL